MKIKVRDVAGRTPTVNLTERPKGDGLALINKRKKLERIIRLAA